MRVLLVLASIIAAAYAGVGVLDALQEDDVIGLWATFCGNGQEYGQDAGTYYYCKNAREDNVENLQHEITVTPSPTAPRQVVFVRPPSTTYNHNVVIKGQAGQAQKTTIYVLPQKNTHTLDYVDQRPPSAAPAKPSLYFLKKDPGQYAPGYPVSA